MLNLSDESEQSKCLLNREINSQRQLQIQFEDLNTTYLQIETQRNELLTNNSHEIENENVGLVITQSNAYQIECKEKRNITSQLKLRVMEINEQLNYEIKPADGAQNLVATKSLENIKLNDQIELLKQQIRDLKDSESSMDNAMEFATRRSANINEIFKRFNLPLEYFLKHLNSLYKNDSNNLLLSRNVVDLNNNQIIVNTQNLNAIFKEFIDVMKMIYITECLDVNNTYNLQNKSNVNILHENERFTLKTDMQRAYKKVF